MTKRIVLPTGPIPDSWQAEEVGHDLRHALVVLTQDMVRLAVSDGESARVSSKKHKVTAANKGGRQRKVRGFNQLPEARSYALPNGRHPMLMPEVDEPWWDIADIHTPALLGKLIRGEVVAFGDPEVTGARPVWIIPRQWRQLSFDPLDISSKVCGGGVTFWNVRCIERARLLAELAAADPAKAFAKPEIVRKPGPDGGKRRDVTERIMKDIRSGVVRQEELQTGLKRWEGRYGVPRNTFCRAREEALAQVAQDRLGH